MRAFWRGGKIDPNNPKIVSLYEGLQNKISKDTQLSYQWGCDWSATNETSIIREGYPRTEQLKMMLMDSSDHTNWDDAVKLASESDIIIAALGKNPTLSGEARQRKGIRLPEDQEKFLKDLFATDNPVVLVIFGGRPQVIEGVDNGAQLYFRQGIPEKKEGMRWQISLWAM